MLQAPKPTDNARAIVTLGLSGASDILALLGLPTELLRTCVQQAIDRKSNRTMKIVKEELSGITVGEVTPEKGESIASAFARFARATAEGSLELNLRLMARVLRGVIERNDIQGSDFLQLATAIDSLSKEEIIVVATIYLETERYSREHNTNSIDAQEVYKAVRSKLITSVFKDGVSLHEAAHAASRSGLIAPYFIMFMSSDNPSVFHTTRLLSKLGDIVSMSSFLDELMHDEA